MESFLALPDLTGFCEQKPFFASDNSCDHNQD
jgi:hypothetical protein